MWKCRILYLVKETQQVRQWHGETFRRVKDGTDAITRRRFGGIIFSCQRTLACVRVIMDVNSYLRGASLMHHGNCHRSVSSSLSSILVLSVKFQYWYRAPHDTRVAEQFIRLIWRRRLTVLEALGRAVLPGNLPNEPDQEEEEPQELERSFTTTSTFFI